MKGYEGILLICGLSGLGLKVPTAFGLEASKQIPDEYESSGGHGLGLNNSGVAVNEPHAAIRANPALLSEEKSYSVSGGYNWPTAGRDYFQASVVDSKTSSTAAGISYTGFMEDYKNPMTLREDPTAQTQARLDSPVIRRGVVGFSQKVGGASIGAGATYVEAFNQEKASNEPFLTTKEANDHVKGFGLNIGIAGSLTPQWRAGASVENASNHKISEYAPRVYKGGVAYLFAPTVTGLIDFRQRDRIKTYESDTQVVDVNKPAAAPKNELLKEPERMVFGSFSAQVQDFLRVLGSYGQALGDDRRSLAGGIGLVNKNFSLSYTASRPYMRLSTAHQAVSLSFDLAM